MKKKAPTSEWPADLTDFILPSGKRLGDATGAEVRAVAQFYLAIGDIMIANGNQPVAAVLAFLAEVKKKRDEV
jgi:hypothetical protein